MKIDEYFFGKKHGKLAHGRNLSPKILSALGVGFREGMDLGYVVKNKDITVSQLGFSD
jgi:hypothetical protein